MQDEVTKHTRKIYREMKNREHGFWQKFREIVIEILIIVFAVTLSIWLHNWSDRRVEQQQTREFLAGLKFDLAKDTGQLDDNRKAYQEQLENFQFLLDLDKSGSVDTMDVHRIGNHFRYVLNRTHANIARYDGFKAGGKIGTIVDDSLQQAILMYYQQMIPAVSDEEEIVNQFVEKLMEAQFGMDEKLSIRAFTKSFKARAYLDITAQNLDAAKEVYSAAKGQARKIIGMINVYLDGKE